MGSHVRGDVIAALRTGIVHHRCLDRGLSVGSHGSPGGRLLVPEQLIHVDPVVRVLLPGLKFRDRRPGRRGVTEA